MKRFHGRHLVVPALIALALPLSALAVTIPAGTPIHVRLQQTLSSNQSHSGQTFDAVLSQPLVVHGRTLAPKGANAWGTVASARPSGRLKTPAQLMLRLTAIQINGRRHPVRTRLVGRTNTSHKKRNEVAIGGGTALGAIIGGIAGGGKGAAIGAAAGAGAGTGGAYATGKKDIVYPTETALTFRLAAATTVE